MSSRIGGVCVAGLAFLAVLTGLFLPTAAQAQGAGEGDPVAPQIVNMQGSKYDPQVAMVQVNQTVNWVNQDTFKHDVTSVDDLFESEGGPGGMEAGEQWSYSFAEAGVYDYYCTVHSDGRGNQMWGRVIVVEPPVLQMAGAGGVENPEHFGVRWLAHWVGIISFLAVIAVLVVYYFVLKYGETVHATDHRDRKEK